MLSPIFVTNLKKLFSCQFIRHIAQILSEGLVFLDQDG